MSETDTIFDRNDELILMSPVSPDIKEVFSDPHILKTNEVLPPVVENIENQKDIKSMEIEKKLKESVSKKPIRISFLIFQLCVNKQMTMIPTNEK